jgi:hypothetical protein
MMLRIYQLLGQSMLMVIVDQGDRGNHRPISRDLRLNGNVSDHVADCLRAAGIAFQLDDPIEFREKVLIQRNPGPNKLRHGYFSLTRKA